MPWEREDFRSRKLQCLGTLGKGSFGETFLVRDGEGNKFVVKRAGDGRGPDDNPQIEAEANVKRLSSDHVVKLYDTWREPGDNRVCLLMEYCNGGDLGALLAESYPLPEHAVTALFAQLLIGLDHIHLHHLLHRDIKPENILLHSGDGLVPIAKIADFGVSKSLAHTDSPATTSLGTPLYLSPEILGGHRYTRKTDVWSMGVAFYKVMTNRMPFTGKTLVDLTRSVLHDEPPHPSCIGAGTALYSLSLGDVVLRMLNRSRSSRPTPRDLLALPIFASVLTEWPWKARSFHECVGVFACQKHARVNIRAAPRLGAEKVGSVRYGDQLYVKRAVLAGAADDEGNGQVMWFRVVSPCEGFCVIGHGAEPFFQLFQNPSRCAASRSATSSTFSNDRQESVLSSSVDPSSISPLFQEV